MVQKFKLGDKVRIVQPLPNETIYVEDYDTDIFEVVSQRRDIPNLSVLRNIQEDTILECFYSSSNLEKV
jgi:hypothetical protein